MPSVLPAFVTFEGIDGSGKSTALRFCADRLRAAGAKVWATREETDGPTGDLVRRSIAERWPPMATAFQFLADRARHVVDIETRRADGHVVLCDRFLHSTLAYQGVTLRAARPDASAFLRGVHDGWCPQPTRVLLFDCDPAKAVARVHGRGHATLYEKASFLEQVRAQYLELARAEPARFVVLDADQPMAALQEAAWDAVAAAVTPSVRP